MAPKGKKAAEKVIKENVDAAGEKVEEPAAKKAKADSAGEAVPADAVKEAPKEQEPEVNVEKEEDAKAVSGAKLTSTISWETSDTTLNVVPTTGGRVLMSLSEGGMQYFIAGARANAGVKSGRYLFEVKVLETLSHAQGQRSQQPRQLVRVGFSTAGSELVLGSTEDAKGMCFDGEGFFYSGSGAKRVTTGPEGRFGTREQTVGILLNLDPKSPNANTLSLFRNGVRASQPQAIPEALKGQPLFPHVAYRNVTLQVNFGPEPLAPLPFKCHMLQAAAAADVSVVKPQVSKDGKREVLFPVGFPDEGTFEWLDAFLEKNPKYTELSDRSVLSWATKSGLWSGNKGYRNSSRDKPEFSFGIPLVDDHSVQKVISRLATVEARDFVVMEVKQNLLAEERSQSLKRFPKALYKRVAHVVMGEPDKNFKKMVHDKLLKDKLAKEHLAWKARKLDKERKKIIAKRQKELAAAQKLKAEEAKKRQEELKAKKDEEDKKAAEAKKETEEKKDDEAAEGEKTAVEAEEKKEEAKAEDKSPEKEATKEEEKAEEVEESADEAEPTDVKLTEEEEKTFFIKQAVPDLSTWELNKCFGQFTVPSKDEGFDDIKYDWQDAKKSKEYLRHWVLEKKRTTRVDNLQPGEAFRTQATEWAKRVGELQAKQTEAKAAQASVPKTGEDEEESKTGGVEISSAEDICNVGDNVPLFLHFGSEDWILMNLRFELYSMIQAFKKDVDDEDRPAIPEPHFGFYYNRYFHKNFAPSVYGKETLAEVLAMVKDFSLSEGEHAVLATSLDADLVSTDVFVKAAEESRRERQRRLDAGDETARLKLSPSLSEKVQEPGRYYAPRDQGEWAPRVGGYQGNRGNKGKGKGKW